MALDETSEFVRTMLDKWLQHVDAHLSEPDADPVLNAGEIYSPILARKKLARKNTRGGGAQARRKRDQFHLASCWPWRTGALITLRSGSKAEGKSHVPSLYKIEILLHLKVNGAANVRLSVWACMCTSQPLVS